jgi:hypothetical protein
MYRIGQIYTWCMYAFWCTLFAGEVPMSFPQVVSGVCAIATIVQGIAAGVFLYEKAQANQGDAVMVSKGKALFLCVSLSISTIAVGFAAGWLWTYKPTPAVVEKIVTVDKPIPCPPAQTGDASTRAAQSPANTGSQNTTTYGTPPPEKK